MTRRSFAHLSLCTLIVAAGGTASLSLAWGEADAGRIQTRPFHGADAGPASRISRDPPDPPPLAHEHTWILDLEWHRGEVSLLDVRRMALSRPRRTPRVIGRFALELFEGPALVERVRFDFPGLGGADPWTHFTRARIGAFFPVTSRGVRLVLHDRKTGERFRVPWPLDETASQFRP